MEEQCYNLRIGSRIKQNWVPKRRQIKRRRSVTTSESDGTSDNEEQIKTPSQLAQSLIDPQLLHSSAGRRQLYFSPVRRRQIATETNSEASQSGKSSPVKEIREQHHDSAQTITGEIEEELSAEKQQDSLLQDRIEYLPQQQQYSENQASVSINPEREIEAENAAAGSNQQTPLLKSTGRGRALEILVAALQRPGKQQAFTTYTHTSQAQHRPQVGVSQPQLSLYGLSTARTLQSAAEIDPFVHRTHTTSLVGVNRTQKPQEQTDVEFLTRQIPARLLQEVRSFDLPIHAARKAAAVERAKSPTHAYPDIQSLFSVPGGAVAAPEHAVSRVQTPSLNSSQGNCDLSHKPDERRVNKAPQAETQAHSITYTGSNISSMTYSQSAFGGFHGPAKINISDTLIAPTHFYGLSTESSEDFLEHFQRYSDFKQLQKRQAAQLFGMLLRGAAGRWYMVLTDAIKNDYDLLIEAFKRSYFKQPETEWLLAKNLWSQVQSPNETVLDFVSRIKRLAHELKADDVQINHAVVAGLQPHLRLAVLQTGQSSLEQTIRFARIAESNGPPSHDPNAANSLLETIKQQNEIAKEQSRQISELTSKLSTLASNTQVAAGVESYEKSDSRDEGRTRAWSPRRPEPKNTPQRVQRENYIRRQEGERPRPLFHSRSDRPRNPCGSCGRTHPPAECKAKGVTCYNCHKLNHLARFCRSARPNPSH